MQGDAGALPYFGQWLGLELLSDELVLWAAEDLRCAFYMFSLPR